MKRALALTALLALGLAACQPAQPGTTSSEVIKLGFIAPLTGDAATLGADMRNGMNMAVDTINKNGGINGKQVQMIAEDGRCTGAEGANAAQKLINLDKVVAVVGGLCSSETIAAAPIAEAAKIVLLSPGSSNPDITNIGTYVFRDYPSDALKTVATAKVFRDKGYKKVAILSENTDFCQGVRTHLRQDLDADAVVFDEVVAPGTKDFRTLLTRLKDVDFDVFYVNPNGDGVMAQMVQQFREAGFTQPMFSHEVADSATLGETAKAEVEGMQLVTVPTAGEGKDFEKDFVAAYGKPQSSIAFAAHAYDATMVLAAVMTQKGTNGTVMRDALLALPSFQGVIGEFHFDKNGDVVGIPFVLKEFKDGKTFKVQDVPLP